MLVCKLVEQSEQEKKNLYALIIVKLEFLIYQ